MLLDEVEQRGRETGRQVLAVGERVRRGPVAQTIGGEDVGAERVGFVTAPLCGGASLGRGGA